MALRDHEGEVAVRRDDANGAAGEWLSGRITTDEFLAQLRTPAMSWVRSAASRNNLPYAEYEDALSEVMVALVRAVHLYDSTPALKANVKNWSAMLRQVAVRETYRFCSAHRQHGVGGLSAMTRRSARITKARRELTAELGYEPDDQSVVDHVNEQVNRSVRDPVKAGARVSVDDLRPHRVVTGDDAHMERLRAADVQQDVDVAIMIDRVIRECERRDPAVGSVARAWVGRVAATGEVASVSEIRSATGLSVRTVRAHIEQVRCALTQRLDER
ncbi:hypothetical protein F8O07_06840 [Pseudoclavibacter sp. CFCC 13796]|uniref:hypothetical protein n=1 Tax=Pseudoclavibacter sp. CFCC 13796 TaxID=2615179 RepID=UPI001300E04C|nr:hypothetical protein [Pseudoclavibacter sp. CFCC 13796]KAB1661615.1 hypothetical protein F8O07_06840 [Pseudoclavibacter sp. CFCC 13796]